ncbi:MAG: endo-polygalacturonase [Tannerella sp.]|nr:endo-polygalacturonase [Tannerella sp.]
MKKSESNRTKTRCFAGLVAGLLLASCTGGGRVWIAPAPEGVALCPNFEVRVNGQAAPVYAARVAPVERELRDKAMDDKANSALYYDMASFACFEMEGKVEVKVTYKETIHTVKILPSADSICARVNGRTATFTMTRPRYLTVEINGHMFNSLHLFADAPDVDIPDKNSPDVIFFEPGIHQLTHLELKDNQTLYLSPGAVVQAVIDPQEPFTVSGYSGLKNYVPAIVLKGKNIRVCGRGILDATGCTTHSREMIFSALGSENIRIEGIVILDSPSWTVPIQGSDKVKVKNLKLIGYRANSDGIDICGSTRVEVADCFIRTHDDLVVIKTQTGMKPASDIHVHGCVLWNQCAHALSLGAELRQDVSRVVFEDCDVIHDVGREWTLRIFHSDKATIRDIRFENIRIEQSVRLISLWLDKGYYSRDEERGHIRNITFKNIHALGEPMTVELKGYDSEHTIDGVLFDNVTRYGKPLTREVIKMNDFVENVVIR